MWLNSQWRQKKAPGRQMGEPDHTAERQQGWRREAESELFAASVCPLSRCGLAVLRRAVCVAGLTGLSVLCHAPLWHAAIDGEQRWCELSGGGGGNGNRKRRRLAEEVEEEGRFEDVQDED